MTTTPAVRPGPGPWLLRRLRAARRRGDEGSGALYLIFGAMLCLLLAGFVVDGGLAIHQRERAADIAEQAARYAANQVDPAALRANGTVSVPANPACTGYANDFASRSGATASCTSAGGNTVTVQVQLTYEPILLRLLGQASITVRASATAQAVQEQ
ncbi:pilus assembly protein TadG-related protein [Kitasatospora sp. NPDC059088]|uniref:pilus assembly protein TadG-related protein n=1 Tax=Kitasatospora sp. NPDC059088 TaxID=3346722 RepID=UPI00367840FE